MRKSDILNIIKVFQENLKIKSSIDINWGNRNELIGEISEKDPKVAIILAGIEESIDSISFFEKDKEMRIKFPDIYKMQLDDHRNNFEIKKADLIQVGEKYGLNISQIISDLDKRQLDISDILNKD